MQRRFHMQKVRSACVCAAWQREAPAWMKTHKTASITASLSRALSLSPVVPLHPHTMGQSHYNSGICFACRNRERESEWALLCIYIHLSNWPTQLGTHNTRQQAGTPRDVLKLLHSAREKEEHKSIAITSSEGMHQTNVNTQLISSPPLLITIFFPISPSVYLSLAWMHK